MDLRKYYKLDPLLGDPIQALGNAQRANRERREALNVGFQEGSMHSFQRGLVEGFQADDKVMVFKDNTLEQHSNLVGLLGSRRVRDAFTEDPVIGKRIKDSQPPLAGWTGKNLSNTLREKGIKTRNIGVVEGDAFTLYDRSAMRGRNVEPIKQRNRPSKSAHKKVGLVKRRAANAVEIKK